MKKFFSRYIAIQILRTKSVRENIRDTYEKINRELIYKEYKQQDITVTKEEIIIEANKTFIKLQHILLMLNDNYINRLSKTLQSHIWIFYINQTDIPFYTSDNPVTTIPHIFNKYLSYSGFNSKGVEVIFPINSKLLLAMYEKSYHRKSYKDCHFIEISDIDRVNTYNSFQVFACHRNIYSNSDNFDIALKLCKENPKIMDINNKINLKWCEDSTESNIKVD